jgi:hypothetical protein
VTQKAIEALAADREALLKIGAGLGETEWGSQSGCPGWSVQSVVAHLGALYWVVVDPSTCRPSGPRTSSSKTGAPGRRHRYWPTTNP